jgi:hypothetical protein
MLNITLSKPSKMPGYAYGIPAQKCHTGSKLRKVEGSTCSHCYALKGNYRFNNVKSAQMRRLKAIARKTWVATMVRLITDTKTQFFRWHDSGDLQSVDHLSKIVDICNQTPSVQHWLPTREYKIITDYLFEHGNFPNNLNVRLSAHMVGKTLNPVQGLTSSTVNCNTGHICPARNQGNQCGDCRACWSKAVSNVDYPLH